MTATLRIFSIFEQCEVFESSFAYRFTMLEGNRQYLYKMGKNEKKKVVLEKTWLSFHSPPRKQPSFSSYVLKESVAVNFDVPSLLPRGLFKSLHEFILIGSLMKQLSEVDTG